MRPRHRAERSAPSFIAAQTVFHGTSAIIAGVHHGTRQMRRFTYLATPLLLLACASPSPAPPAATVALPSPEPAVASPPDKVPALRRPATATAKRPTPNPTRPLNVTSNCRFRDESGYSGTLNLTVENARVQAFSAAVTIPRRGSCRFDLRNFRQTRSLPTIELSHQREACTVRFWEQAERVTVAFDNCRKMCTGEAWDYLWPILADRSNGSCA